MKQLINSETQIMPGSDPKNPPINSKGNFEQYCHVILFIMLYKAILSC